MWYSDFTMLIEQGFNSYMRRFVVLNLDSLVVPVETV